MIRFIFFNLLMLIVNLIILIFNWFSLEFYLNYSNFDKWIYLIHFESLQVFHNLLDWHDTTVNSIWFVGFLISWTTMFKNSLLFSKFISKSYVFYFIYSKAKSFWSIFSNKNSTNSSSFVNWPYKSCIAKSSSPFSKGILFWVW